LSNKYLETTFGGRPAPFFKVAQSYFSRLKLLLEIDRYDLIWIQYETFPYLPGLAEKLVLRGKTPIVYDFDDAIFHQYDDHPNAYVRALLGNKLRPLLQGASLCVCGNAYLKSYADRFSPKTEIVPTVLDTSIYSPGRLRRDPSRPIVIGWIGSPSTWRFVEPIVPTLERLAEELDLLVRIVGAGPTSRTHPRFEFIEWTEVGEIAAIQGMDVGIMPLPDHPWAHGKCGYKLIQYMACGIPAIASPVGINSQIVDHGVNGFVATKETEWETCIRLLAGDATLRASMGERGREKIIDEYSLHLHGPRLASMLREIADTHAARE
jgi:glycosyltransferase involved in cell wall biosynthesis